MWLVVRLAHDQDDVDSIGEKSLVQRIALKKIGEHLVMKLTEKSLDGLRERLKGISIGDAKWRKCHVVPTDWITI